MREKVEGIFFGPLYINESVCLSCGGGGAVEEHLSATLSVPTPLTG
jgi:hypothetical protein